MTIQQLRLVMSKLSAERAEARGVPLLEAMAAGSAIVGPLREAAFMAQIAHESGELRHYVELWGPTDAQRRYEGRRDLGNVFPGDGFRFRGRGPIQITGRANYSKYGKLIGVELELNPHLASHPDIGARAAVAFWLKHGLNELADARDLASITRKINGGLNGLAERRTYYDRALAVLGADVAVDERRVG